MRRNLPLPRGWNRHVKPSVLQVLSLAQHCVSTVRGRVAKSRVLRRYRFGNAGGNASGQEMGPRQR